MDLQTVRLAVRLAQASAERFEELVHGAIVADSPEALSVLHSELSDAADLRKIAALWKKDGKNGTFYSGKLNAEEVKSALAGDEVRLLLFKVKNKRERGPDVELFCAPDEPRGAKPPTDDDGFGDLP